MDAVKYKWESNLSGLEMGLAVLGAEYHFETSEKGYPMKLIPASDKLCVSFDNGQGTIAYGNKSQFFRAVGLLTEQLLDGQEKVFIEETPQFDNVGIMLPVSNSIAMTVHGIKQFLTKMAIMGYTQLLLYMEDMYEMSDYPDFGYMRGRYSAEDLKEIDDFGFELGIEIIPCIQTLGHLTLAMQRDYAREFQDTGAVLLVGEEKTYQFIDRMIGTLAGIFRSKQIHLGMDEAFDLGYGQYLVRNGYKHRFEIFNEHLKRVQCIVEKYGLTPMVWGDMFLSINTKHGMDQLEEGADVSDDMILHTPKDYTIAIWNYSYLTKEKYLEYFEKYRKLNMRMVFCSAVWTWHGRCPQYPHTFRIVDACMCACKEIGIRDMFITLWGGASCSLWMSLLGLQQFAEYAYHERPGKKHIEKRADFCTGYKSEFFHIISDIDIPTVTVDADELVQDIPTPTSYILTQDILCGIYDKTSKGFDFKRHFYRCIERLREYHSKHPENEMYTDYYIKLCRAAFIRSDLGQRLKAGYDDNDRRILKVIAEDDIPAALEAYADLRQAHYRWWMSYNKPHGWEISDNFYGGQMGRLRTAQRVIRQYIRGEIGGIEELEVERLNAYDDDNFLVSYSGPAVRVNSNTFILTY